MIDELKDVELYELLGVLQSATVDEIKSAYRKKALKCHPDKNPDNPKACELFHQLSKALEVLIDCSARAAYDKVINAKKAAKLRHQELDSRRKKFKEELETKEKEAELASRLSNKNVFASTKTDEDKLRAEIERLRKEGSKQLQEEIELVRLQIIEEARNSSKDIPSQKRLKIRWTSSKDDETNGGYNTDILNKIFSKYGDIEALVISSKKKGSALVEFTTSDAADKAQKYEKGLPTNPLSVEWIEKPIPTSSNSRVFGYSNIEPNQRIFPSSNEKAFVKNENTSQHSIFPKVAEVGVNSDFESLVLRKMRQAEERKRLTEEMKKEDDAT